MQPLYQPLDYYSFESILKKYAFKKDLMVLHSASIMDGYGRYSFICVNAFAVFSAKKNKCSWNQACISLSDPFLFIQEQLNQYPVEKNEHLPPFQGGAVGYFGYEACHYLEHFERVAESIALPDIYLCFYDQCLAFDHQNQKAWVICTGYPEKDPSLRIRKAQQDLIAIQKELEVLPCHLTSFYGLKAPLSNVSKAVYEKAVLDTKDYILSGDIFEANISQQWSAPWPEHSNPMGLYLHLIQKNPAPFSAYVTIPDQGHIVSASPERFIQKIGKKIYACPIKGTIKRSEDAREDQQLAQALVSSEKDRAENIMIVDLMRNDFSKICYPGTVDVEQLCALKTFKTVHHLVSTICGEPKQAVTVMDILKAAFPAGSITGAPKIRAMEIISALEQRTRGPYCGSIGYFSFSGEMDTSVAIRTYAIDKKNIYFSAGGAVVLDSDPEREYFESVLKAQALIEVLTHDFVD